MQVPTKFYRAPLTLTTPNPRSWIPVIQALVLVLGEEARIIVRAL